MKIYNLIHEVNEENKPSTTFEILRAYESQEGAIEALIDIACAVATGESTAFRENIPTRIPSSFGIGLTYEWEDEGRIFYTHYKIKETELY